MKLIEIQVNCPSLEVAQMIADRLLEQRLVACSNIHAEIQSSYHWKGSIERENEIPLVLKTREELFESVAARVGSLHPYETPSIIGLPVEWVNRDYLSWIYRETAAAGEP
jgi:periplasmic divalent cation tolerance protein